MPQSDAYVSSLFPRNAGKLLVRGRALSHLEIASLDRALRIDARDFYYSAWISFLDAINGINKGFFTWPTVKLYYSVFYAFRASLAIDAVCIFHIDRSAYAVAARQGERPASISESGTHKAVLRAFQRLNPSHPLVSQQIDLMDAVDWLMDQRESANYRRPRFDEPQWGHQFDYVCENGVRRSLNAYIADASLAYAFDPDHAMLAYPLSALLMIGAQLMPAALPGPSREEQVFLRSRARDQAGSLATIVAELKRLNLLGAG